MSMEILLVEDDLYCVDFFKRRFNKHNQQIQLQHVGSAEEARGYLEEKTNVREICLIVLDIKLPRISGFELLRFVKESQETRSIPVVMFTSSSERQDIELSYQLGANSYLIKPIDYEAFGYAIGQMEEYWLKANTL